jgi:tetratricopeptide (TPR) repeat protein
MLGRGNVSGPYRIAMLVTIGIVLLMVFQPKFCARAANAAGGRGMAYHANLRYDEALTEYTRASQLDSANWRWPYYRALVHLERGEAAQAADALRTVTQLEPGHVLTWWRLGEAEFKQGRYEEADRAYLHAEGDPAVGSYASRGRARIRSMRAGATPTSEGGESSRGSAYKPPRDPMIDALADLSTNSVFLIRQAAATDISRDPERREQLVRRALEVDPRNPDVVYEMGAVLQQRHRAADALPFFVRHLDMVEDDQQTLMQIGKCYSDLGRFDEAEETLRRALALGDDATGFYNLGFVLEQRGRRDEAEEYYGRALRADPTHASAHNNLAALLAEGGQLTQAQAHWAAILRFNPEHADAHANMGASLAQQGRFAEALRHLDEALRLNPRHAAARKLRDAIAIRGGHL